jgi:hypothetical protein
MIKNNFKMSDMKFLLFFIANFSLLGCAEKHMRSDSICDGKFYVELYQEWSDMGAIYLTDSVNFRVKVYIFNAESEYYKHYCKPDSIIIEKWSKDELTPKHILETKTFSIKKLTEEGKLGK